MTQRTGDEPVLNSRLRGASPRRLVVLAALAVACSSDATGPVGVASVQVTPQNVQTLVGSTVQLFAMPRDANGGDLPGRAVTWSSANPAVATVSGGGMVTGVAPGTVQISASSEGHSGNTTVAVTSPPVDLAFTVQPGSVTAGVAFAPALQVTVRDALGNTATGFTGSVTLALAANPGGAALSGTTTVAAVAGVATFAGVSLDKSGVGYTLQASAGGLTAVTSAPFAVTAAAATHLLFSVQPSTTAAGAAIAPAVQVTARDAFGNTATGFTGAVTIAIGTNPSGGTLSGTATVNAVSGVAIFGSLSIDRSGGGYTLSATAGGLSAATSTSFSVTTASVSASQSTVVAAPATITASAGSSASTVTVTARDAFGNPVSGVTVVLAASGGGNTITQPGLTNASGVATGTVSSTAAGVKTISATAGGVAVTETAAVTVEPGTATQLAFTVQPSPTGAGAAITPAVQVTARDAFGNTATGFAGPVTVAIGTNPGLATLSGTTTVAAVAGVATFSDLSINRTGTGYTLTATGTGLTDATSSTFSVSSAPVTLLSFTVQPSTTSAGAPITPAVQVTARDQFGNTNTGFTGTVCVAIGINPTGNGVLSGTACRNAANGVVTFNNLSIDRASAGYTLVATSVALTGATSATFTITAGAPATIALVSGDGQTDSIGATLAAPFVVRVTDAQGNGVSGVTVTWAVTGGGGSITPTSLTNGTGQAQATRVLGNTAGAQTATASVSGLAGSPVSFAAIAGPGNPSQLAFTVQPSTTSAGSAIAPAVQVTARDRIGTTTTGFTGNVTVAIGTNPAGGSLSGTATAAGVAGVATFASLSIDKAGTGYTLTAAAAGLTGTTSAPFTITASTVSPSQSTVAAAPATIAASSGTSQSTITVTARDALGNPVSGAAVVLAATGSGNTIIQPAGLTNASGVATGTLSSTGAGPKTVSATASGVAITQTASVTVNPTTATQLEFTVEPGTTAAGAPFSPAVQVTAWDAFGNTATGFTGTVTVAIGNNPVAGVLDGTGSVAAVLGVATFPGLNIDEAGPGYTLTASASGLSGAVSGAFDVTVGPAATVALVSGNAQTDTVGATLALPYVVRVTDAVGNAVSGVTVTWAVTGGGGTITPSSVTSATGQAQATRVLGNTPGAQTATAAVAGLAGSPVSFTATANPGNTTQLAFTTQPTSTVAGSPLTPAVRVTARDRLGNTTTAFTGNVTVAIGTNPGGGTLSGTATVAAVAGVATFSSLSIDRTGTGYRLTAAATGLSGATSSAFPITPGPATQLAFTVQPASTSAGVTITPAVRVTARDAFGNTATGFTGTVTVAIGTNPAGGTLSGTTAVAAAAGVATFANLSINTVGTGYTLTASAPGLSGATSSTFNIVTVISATLSTLASATDTIGQCLTACALGLDASRITVTVRDASGNPLAGVSVTLSASPADSVLFLNPGASGTTNGSGVFAADFRSVRAVNRTISAVAGGVPLSQTATVRVMPVLVGAGDIATCTALSDDAVATLLDSIPGTVFTLGDNAYDHGTDAEFANCYDPTWGRHLARTRAVAGNRDYDTPGATGHYGYFGAAANPSGGTGNTAGYYSYDLGGWHIVVLNTEIATASNSAQMAWLLQDLTGRTNQCVAAMWHKPMFASSSGGSGSAVPLWETAAAADVEIVLNGHSHVYERLAPLDANGNQTPTGVRTFIVGTGGIGLGGFSTDPPYSDVRDRTTHGVLRLVLYPNRYRWQFIPAPGFGSFTDSGTESCN